MKRYINAIEQNFKARSLCLLIAFLSSMNGWSQEYATLSGKLSDESSNSPIPYANVALFGKSDDKLIRGVISDTSGNFSFINLQAEHYLLKISMIGYEQISKEIDVSRGVNYNEGTIYMKQSTVNLEETVVTAERPKGKVEKDRTTYFITMKMADASNNGLDIIKLIPGVQVDFRRNISLEGSRDIVILVDGKERDNNYVSALDPDQIDRVEILSAPPSRYEAGSTGAINIVLKREKESGVNGKINLEIPASVNHIYIHPDYTIGIKYKKLNLFTSYNAEMIRFDQHEGVQRKVMINETIFKSGTDQYVQQKLWSHRFHYGFDYDLTSRTQINFYAFYNPYSQEYKGNAHAFSNINGDYAWEAKRSSSDINHSTLYSMYFKHTFDEKGTEVSFDISNYHLKGDNQVKYEPINQEIFSPIENHTRPVVNAFSMKVDGIMPIGNTLELGAGARLRINGMEDHYMADFNYQGKVFSSYASLGYSKNKFDLNTGLRLENSVFELKHKFRKPLVNLLPFASASYKISSDKSMKLALSKTIYRPNLYQLNPNLSTDDPNTIRSGNPDLDPEVRTSLFFEYSKKYKSDFYSVRLFYNRNDNCINNLTQLNEALVFETRVYNLGKIVEMGLQLAGTFNLAKMITFNPYLRLYRLNSVANHFSEGISIQSRKQVVVEPGFSSVIAFKHDINLSMNLQYASPKNNIQGTNFSDPLFLVSLDKTFKRKFKTGIAGILPFKKPFTYQGSEVNSNNFHSRYSGDIHLSTVLLWFKLSYQFNSETKNGKFIRSYDESDMVPKRGF